MLPLSVRRLRRYALPLAFATALTVLALAVPQGAVQFSYSDPAPSVDSVIRSGRETAVKTNH